MNVALSGVYNIGTTGHRIYVGGIAFGDMHETDHYEVITAEQSLDVMNGMAVVERASCSMANT